MRTTIDLPDDLLEMAKSIARGRRQTLGEAVADLIRRAIDPPEPAQITISPVTGLPVLHLGGPPINQADIDQLDDDDDARLADVRSYGQAE